MFKEFGGKQGSVLNPFGSELENYNRFRVEGAGGFILFFDTIGLVGI